MTLKELCSQFIHEANLVIIDVTFHGKDITEIVRKNKDLFHDTEVEDIDIIGDHIQVIVSSKNLESFIKAYEGYKVIKDFCTSRPTNNDCRTCPFRDKTVSVYEGSEHFCILAKNTPQFWDDI